MNVSFCFLLLAFFKRGRTIMLNQPPQKISNCNKLGFINMDNQYFTKAGHTAVHCRILRPWKLLKDQLGAAKFPGVLLAVLVCILVAGSTSPSRGVRLCIHMSWRAVRPPLNRSHPFRQV